MEKTQEDTILDLRQECDELNAIFDAHWKAEMRGIKMWQKATGRKLTWPSTDTFTVWLIDRLERAEEVIEAARPLGDVTMSGVQMSETEQIALDVVLHIVDYDKQNQPSASEG